MENQKAVEIISKLAAYSHACKFSAHFPVYGNAEHLYADDFNDKLTEFWDEVTEDFSFTYGRIEPQQQIVSQLIFENLEELIRAILSDVIEWRQAIEADGDPRNLGILSLMDDFIHVINQFGYRSQLS